MIRCEIRADNTLHIEGYVNAVERDSRPVMVPSLGRCVEQVRAGVFGAALAANPDVELLENHDHSRKLGSTSDGVLALSEDAIGLSASADISDADIIAKARTGQLKGWSFGFVTTSSEVENRADNIPRRVVTGMKLSEVSLIDGRYTPCYAGTLVEVRAIDDNTEIVEFRADEEIEVVDNLSKERAGVFDYSLYENRLRRLRLNDTLYKGGKEYRGRGDNYTKDEHGRFTGSTSSGGGSGNSSESVDKAAESDIINHKEDIIKELKDNGFPYDPKIPPATINVDELTFDSHHANVQRNHNVSEEEAKSFIVNADYSYSRIIKTKNGKTTTFENYFSQDGASYVNVDQKIIQTSFKRSEFTSFIEENAKILDKYRK